MGWHKGIVVITVPLETVARVQNSGDVPFRLLGDASDVE
jgi:hypothetical protein